MPARPPLLLAVPFAATGLAGGWATAQVMFGTHAHGFSRAGLYTLTTMVTPITACALGGLLARIRSRWVSAIVFPFAVVMAGVINGVVLAVLSGSVGDPGVNGGALVGAMLGTLFLPVLIPVFIAWCRMGHARKKTLVDGAHRRGVWVATFAAIALGDCVLGGSQKGYGSEDLWPVVVLPVCLVALVALLGADVHAVVSLLRIARRVSQRVPVVGENYLDFTEWTVDFGLGEQLAEVRAETSSAYRDLNRRLVLIKGTPRAAARSLALSLALDTLAIGLVVACVLCFKPRLAGHSTGWGGKPETADGELSGESPEL